MSDEIIEELKETSKPVIDFLNKYYNMHATVMINTNFIRVVKDDIGIPIKK